MDHQDNTSTHSRTLAKRQFPKYEGDCRQNRMRGRWIKDFERLKQCEYHGASCNSKKCRRRITIPSEKVFQRDWYFASERQQQDETLRPMEVDNAQAPPSSTPHCRFLDVPPEIMRQILGHVLPSGNVYHFIPTKRGPVIQKMVPASDEEPNVISTALAATCSEFHGIVCSMLYGENEFIFNVSTREIETVKVFSNDFATLQSWTRLFQNQTSDILGPLSARSMPYLRTVSLSISYPVYMKSRTMQPLIASVARVVELLQHTNAQNLSLTVDFQPETLADRRPDKAGNKKLHVEVGPDGRVHANLRGSVVRRARLRWNNLQRALEPLKALHGLRSVHIFGEVDQEYAEEIVRAIATAAD